MTKTIIAAALLAALASSAPARAEPHAMKMAASTGAKTGVGVGVVKAVDAKAGTVTIQHGPIPAVGWPGMTMAFHATTPAVLNAAKVGRQVAFGVRVTGAKAEVTSIRPK